MENGDLVTDGTRTLTLVSRVAPGHAGGFYSVVCDNETGREFFIKSYRLTKTCNHAVADGNVDDPSFAFCGHPAGHAGDHGAWIF